MSVPRRHLALTFTLGFAALAATAQTPPQQTPPAQQSQGIVALQQKASAGDAAAQNLLGDSYRFAIGIARDENLAHFWYRKAADQGNVEAFNSLGDMAYYGNGEPVDYAASLAWYQKAADKGDAKGEFNVGYMYAHGRGTAQDYAQALVWYRKAADQNYADAENLLGDMYYYGRGINVDYDQALALYHKAADRGDATGQFNIGYMYANGRGMKLDYAQAIAWYHKAAAQNQFEAESSLGDMYYYGLGVTQDYAQAVAWYQKAAAQGDVSAEYHLGLCYEWGRGIAKDIAQARTWLQKSAEQGAQPAKDELARLDAPIRGFVPEGTSSAAAPAPPPAIPIPHNYALIFATDDYAHWPHLTNPIPDADAVNQALTSLYGFQVDEVKNATSDQILLKLNEYLHRKFEPQDQLIIFFSGHGYFDEDLGQGFIVPADAPLVKDDPIHRSLLAYDVIMRYVNRIPATHIVLMADACFSGTLDRKIAEGSLRGDASDVYTHATLPELLERKETKRTRRYFASGGKDFVPDGLPGHHSPFISAFLVTLNDGADRKGYLTLADIQQGLESVIPEPRWGDIQQDNDPGADFLLLTPDAVAKLSHPN